ncbi:MAG: hypothetical protein A3F09_01950 [Chlamydiae bacterium RIFCSPHIGHO2_12_FULL_49_11]|nr:MAG: hypothetical protein A3F09_01950 [Chlamydiae bacterium RIFCSPHIGHO2_12_FULL_49_11]
MHAIASVVHSFVNAAAGVPWNVEAQEIRNFHSLAYWTQMLENRHFVRISKESHVLPGDPTENAMALFVKEPQDIGELRTAISYRKDCTRTKDSTRATWIEWGNVRYAKQYAEFIQKHHSYAFDFVGHLTQHWLFFLHYLRESRKDKIPLKQILLSDNFAMNLFILIAATFQGLSGLLFSLPARLIARLQDGPRWRSDTNLTELEKFDARVEDEYSKYIDHTPFYMFDYLGKISEVWSIVFRSKESLSRRVINVVQALISSLGLVIKAAISAPIRAIYTSEANLEPDTIKVLIFDPADELDNAVIRRWEKEKDPVYHAHHKIEVVHSTPDHFKLVSIPRYRPFTTICGYLSETFNLEVLEIGSQTEISADVILHPAEATASFPDARLVYELPKLQDEQNRRFATYHFKVPALKALFQSHAVIEYIHE